MIKVTPGTKGQIADKPITDKCIKIWVSKNNADGVYVFNQEIPSLLQPGHPIIYVASLQDIKIIVDMFKDGNYNDIVYFEDCK